MKRKKKCEWCRCIDLVLLEMGNLGANFESCLGDLGRDGDEKKREKEPRIKVIV